MKRHHCFALCLIVSLTSAPSVPAQTDKPLDTIPLEVRTADQLTAVQRQEVQQYISDWVAILQDDSNPQQQSVARDKLTSDVVAVGTQGASIDYQSEYAGTIDKDLMPLTANPDTRVRLLAGIVAGRVAEHVSNARLADLALALLNDKSDAVVVWGMRTARYVMPWVLVNPMVNSPLPPAVISAVRNHPDIPLAEDAYEAFIPPAGADSNALLAAVGQIMDLLRIRIGEYQRLCPVDPAADSFGTTFLSIRGWPVMAAPQRLEAVQQISNLLSVMAQRCLADDRAEMPRLLAGLQPVAAAIYVIGNAEQAPNVVAAAKPVAQQHFGPQTPPQQIIDLVAKMYPALVAVPDFAQLKPPPPLIQSTTAPTTAP
jgi:hypothetical protein